MLADAGLTNRAPDVYREDNGEHHARPVIRICKAATERERGAAGREVIVRACWRVGDGNEPSGAARRNCEDVTYSASLGKS